MERDFPWKCLVLYGKTQLGVLFVRDKFQHTKNFTMNFNEKSKIFGRISVFFVPWKCNAFYIFSVNNKYRIAMHFAQ